MQVDNSDKLKAVYVDLKDKRQKLVESQTDVAAFVNLVSSQPYSVKFYDVIKSDKDLNLSKRFRTWLTNSDNAKTMEQYGDKKSSTYLRAAKTIVIAELVKSVKEFKQVFEKVKTDPGVASMIEFMYSYPNQLDPGYIFTSSSTEGITSEDIGIWMVLDKTREIQITKTNSASFKYSRWISSIYWHSKFSDTNWSGWPELSIETDDNDGAPLHPKLVKVYSSTLKVYDFVMSDRLSDVKLIANGGSGLFKIDYASFPQKDKFSQLYGRFTEIKLTIPGYTNTVYDTSCWVVCINRIEAPLKVTSNNPVNELNNFIERWTNHLIEAEQRWVLAASGQAADIPTSPTPVMFSGISRHFVEERFLQSAEQLDGCVSNIEAIIKLPSLLTEKLKPKALARDEKVKQTSSALQSTSSWSKQLQARLPPIQLLDDNWLRVYELCQLLEFSDSALVGFNNDTGSGVSALNHYITTRKAHLKTFEWISFSDIPLLKEGMPDRFEDTDRKVSYIIATVTDSELTSELMPLHYAMSRLNFRGNLIIQLNHRMRAWILTIICHLFEEVVVYMPISSGGNYFIIAKSISEIQKENWVDVDYRAEAVLTKANAGVIESYDAFFDLPGWECDAVDIRVWLKNCPVEELPPRSRLNLNTIKIGDQYIKDISSDEPAEISLGAVELQLTRLTQISEVVDAVKNRYTPTQYSEASRRTEFTKEWRSAVEKRYSAQIATNAWFKMWEILTKFPELIEDGSVVLFGAELPGAFISCVNHYMSSSNRQFSWLANSLVESNQALTDIYGIIPSYKANWIMGNTPGNGNLCSAKEILRLATAVKKIHSSGVGLYISDLGFPIKDDEWGKEEELHQQAQLGQFLFGILTLSDGGSCVIKMFTTFRPFTVSMIYLIATMFETVHVFKPFTSRARNSEWYFVGMGYKKTTSVIKKYIFNRLKSEPFDNSVLCSVPESYIDKIVEMSTELFQTRQVQALEADMETSKPTNAVGLLKRWEKVNRLRKLELSDRLNLKGSKKDEQLTFPKR